MDVFNNNVWPLQTLMISQKWKMSRVLNWWESLEKASMELYTEPYMFKVRNYMQLR
jgi:hypothetical protein